MKYKMIVADCDDTMLNSAGGYTEHFRNTLNRYINKGGKFVIATGRMTASTLPYCYDLGLKGEVITYQGAVTADISTGKVIDITKITYKDAYEVAKYIESLGLYFHIYSGDNFYVNKSTKYTKRYAKLINLQYKELNYEISKFIMDNKLDTVKMMILTEEENVMPLINHLQEKFEGKLLFNTSKKWMVEIVPIASNKGVAVANLAKKYGIRREEIICIGDSLNDLAMIEYAGLGVVVENGSADMKKIADVIAPSNDNDGVAFVINKYGFLE